jgi:hypothetical protein
MISGIVRFVLFRLLGARVLLVLTILGWVRNRLRGERSRNAERRTG